MVKIITIHKITGSDFFLIFYVWQKMYQLRIKYLLFNDDETVVRSNCINITIEIIIPKIVKIGNIL
jgi:hypothetical protein